MDRENQGLLEARAELRELAGKYLFLHPGHAVARVGLALGDYVAGCGYGYPVGELERDIRKWDLIERPDLVRGYLRARFDEVRDDRLEEALRNWGLQRRQHEA